jgi:hypothetical protein
MSRNYKIIQLRWNNPRVYSLIGPYAMNSSVVRRLENPITTNDKTTWLLLYESDTLKAFCAVMETYVSMHIKNFIPVDGNNSWFFEFIKIITDEFYRSGVDKLYCYVPTNILEQALNLGFKETTPGKNWHRLIKEK